MGGNERARRLAAYYKNKFKTNDPFEIADHLNIILTESPLNDFSGCYLYTRRQRIIIINSEIEDRTFRKIVMAHELGHALLHKTENCYFMKNHTLFLKSKIELQANIFTAELLISDSLIFDYAGWNITQIAHAEGLNEELLKLKFYI